MRIHFQIIGLLFLCTILQAQHPPRMIAEWEPALGTLIRWPLNIPVQLVQELAADDSLYILVETAGELQNATASLESWEVNTSHVRFIQTNTFSSWTRDWGPQGFFTSDLQMAYADPIFNGYPWVPGCDTFLNSSPNPEASSVDGIPKAINQRGYEEDDVIPGDVAAFMNVQHQNLNIYLTGGNIMTDGRGTAFSTAQIIAENHLVAPDGLFFSEAAAQLGLDDYHILENPEIFGIQHIDCYAKLLHEELVLIKEVDQWHPEYECCENLADYFAEAVTCYGRPYRVERIYCGSYSGTDVAAYTNSLILNEKVLVPVFDIASDSAALDVYQNLMAGYEVLGIPYYSWFYYDALHCRTMGLFDPDMIHLSHPRLAPVETEDLELDVTAVVIPCGESQLAEPPGLHWRIPNLNQWHLLPMSDIGDNWVSADLPDFPAGTTFEYFLEAQSSSGRIYRYPSAGMIRVNVGDICHESLLLDVNGDGAYNILDVIQTVNIITGYVEPDTCTVWCSDGNLDGSTDVLDIIMMVQFILQQ